MKKIAIQGILGSNHHIAAEKYFGKNTTCIPCSSFDELIQKTKMDEVDYAIMALENSIAGSIIPNYRLIDESDLFISGEYKLPIEHMLLGTQESSFEGIKKIYSHPMALLQCKDFFMDYPEIELAQFEDTAAAAKMIAKKNNPELAAIAPSISAEMYDLKILKENIQTIKNNQTRFIVIQKERENIADGEDKASLKIILNHEKNSLLHFLKLCKESHLNLSKIQSMPIIEEPWSYAFFIDVLFEENNFKKALEIFDRENINYKVLGLYKKST